MDEFRKAISCVEEERERKLWKKWGKLATKAKNIVEEQLTF